MGGAELRAFGAYQPEMPGRSADTLTLYLAVTAFGVAASTCSSIRFYFDQEPPRAVYPLGIPGIRDTAADVRKKSPKACGVRDLPVHCLAQVNQGMKSSVWLLAEESTRRSTGAPRATPAFPPKRPASRACP
jgi:hypothetical protein